MNSGTTRLHCAAATSSADPAAASSQPRVSATRRPRCAARVPRGSPNSAAPSVLAVRARPAIASSPVTSLASRMPIDGATPTPTVPMTWATISTASVRRCTARTSGVARSAAVVMVLL